MKYLYMLAALTAVLTSSSAGAQSFAGDIATTPQSGQTYVTLGGVAQANSLSCFATTGFCANAEGVNLNQFASAASLDAQIGKTNSKLFDLSAAAAALKDAIPNYGDRFALRLNMGAAEGHFAGALGASANVTDQIRLSANYGRGQNEDMFSAGLNFSFH